MERGEGEQCNQHPGSHNGQTDSGMMETYVWSEEQGQSLDTERPFSLLANRRPKQHQAAICAKLQWKHVLWGASVGFQQRADFVHEDFEPS